MAANYGIIHQSEEEPALKKVDQETWEEICQYRKVLKYLGKSVRSFVHNILMTGRPGSGKTLLARCTWYFAGDEHR
jgi:DNA replication protein DnaC